MAEKKTSSSSWQELLKADLKSLARKTEPRIVLLGIGNEFNGDDAAGVWIARRLLSLLSDVPNLLILDCGTVPENAIGRLRRFEPEFVLLIDAAEIGRNPGEVQYLNPHVTGGFSASSHSLPFSVLANYIEKEFNCPVGMLGIQPGSMEFDTGLSSAVKNSVVLVIKTMVETFRPSS